MVRQKPGLTQREGVSAEYREGRRRLGQGSWRTLSRVHRPTRLRREEPETTVPAPSLLPCVRREVADPLGGREGGTCTHTCLEPSGRAPSTALLVHRGFWVDVMPQICSLARGQRKLGKGSPSPGEQYVWGVENELIFSPHLPPWLDTLVQ